MTTATRRRRGARGLRRLGLAALGLLGACGGDRSVALVAIAGSGVQGEVQLHEALTKSF